MTEWRNPLIDRFKAFLQEATLEQQNPKLKVTN